MQAQLLDSMDLERERGITIKLQAARMFYKAKDGHTYLLNLIDTPGHVDFGYEVSRSLAACEGALLVVDAAQGVEAQTIANVYLALDNDLEIVPVVNKIDLPAAEPERVIEEVENTIGLDCTDAVLASAKNGIGIQDILEAVVERVPPPEPPECEGQLAKSKQPLRALIFDSYYDNFRGVIVFFRVVEGSLKKGDKVRFLASKTEHELLEVGVMTPVQTQVDELRAGEVGYLTAAIKELDDARVGDTIALAKSYDGLDLLPGYAPSKPMVFCGLYPSDGDDYEKLRDAIAKLKLNDAALTYSPETSTSMGFGFRCGFLGLLHMDIVQERLEREFDINLIVTAPSVVYKIKKTKNGVTTEEDIDTPAKMPDPTKFDEILEPYVRLEIMTPQEYNGPLMDLGSTRRGIFIEMKYLSPTRTTLIYDMPLAEVITDFFDQLKSRSKGYASMSFEQTGYRPDKLVKMMMTINDEDAPALALIVHRDKAYDIGKAMTGKLKEFIPRQQFKVSIRACIGTTVVASSTIGQLSKDVLAKCYGGDISRKKKLLQKQKEGKKRMKALGKVNVPQEAFMAVIRINDGGKK
jgi:GTP-binding protein LepA